MNDFSTLSIWLVAREYAGIAEAGGVKNVVCSLSEGLSALNANVTLFIPLYGCTNLAAVHDYSLIPTSEQTIKINEIDYTFSYAKAKIKNVNIVFVISSCFSEKNGVYTYTESEENENPNHKKGEGHADSLQMEILFQKAVIFYGVKYSTIPNVIHCHDATTALIPCFANSIEFIDSYKNVKFLVTIHNAGPAYHHQIDSLKLAQNYTNLPKEMLEKGLVNGHVEPYFLAGFYSTLTTVSPFYADEITNPHNAFTDGLSEAFSNNNMQIIGITNGIDFEKYNPTDVSKSLLPFAYNPENLSLAGKYKASSQFIESFSKNPAKSPTKGVEQFGFLEATNKESVLFSYHGRLVHQKGLSILAEAIPLCLSQNKNIKFIINGQGSIELENQQIELANSFPGSVLYLRGYERSLARLSVAASDFIVLPSYFEPCGLEDFIASIMGTVPVAHKTGGLNKIIDNISGFLYSENTPISLANKILQVADIKQNNIEQYNKILQTAAIYVHQKYDWTKVIQNDYAKLFF